MSVACVTEVVPQVPGGGACPQMPGQNAFLNATGGLSAPTDHPLIPANTNIGFLNAELVSEPIMYPQDEIAKIGKEGLKARFDLARKDFMHADEQLDILKSLKMRTEEVTEKIGKLEAARKSLLNFISAVCQQLSLSLYEEPKAIACPQQTLNNVDNSPPNGEIVKNVHSGSSEENSSQQMALPGPSGLAKNSQNLNRAGVKRPAANNNGSKVNKKHPNRMIRNVPDRTGYQFPSRFAKKDPAGGFDGGPGTSSQNIVANNGGPSNASNLKVQHNAQILMDCADIDNKENENVDTHVEEVQAVKKPKIPYIYMVADETWQEKLALIQTVAPSMQAQLKNNKFRIKVESEEEFREVIRFMGAHKFQFNSYNLKDERPFKIIVRGIPPTTNPDRVADTLRSRGFSVISAIHLTRRGKAKSRLPIVYVKLRKTPEVDEVFNIVYMLKTTVEVQRYKGRKGPSQCYRCQGFFHSSEVCNLPVRCVRCAGSHWSRDCPNSEDDPLKCVNCHASHAASWRGCPKFPGNARKAKNPALPNVSKNSTERVYGSKGPSNDRFNQLPPRDASVRDNVSYSDAIGGRTKVHSPGSGSGSPPSPIQNSTSSIPIEDILKAIGLFSNTYGWKLAHLTLALDKARPLLRQAVHGCDAAYYILKSYNELFPAA